MELIAFSELENQFKMFIVKNYTMELEEYLSKKAKHTNKGVMKEVLLSTISIILNVADSDCHKLTKNDYFI